MVILILLTVGGLTPLNAQSRWTFAAGEHFEVYTTGGDAVARRALDDFDRIHTYLEDALHIPAISGPRTRLIIFNSREEFAPYASNPNVKAFYQSGVDGDFVVLPGLNGESFRAIAHEYSHLVSRRTGRHYPLWLDDGLAEYFSTVTPQGTKLQIGAAPGERQRSLGFGVRLMPLEQLFAITRDSADYNNPARTGLFYAQSWALTHMLLTDERYRDKSAGLLGKLAHGEPSALALTSVYAKTVDEIARDLSKYTLRGNFRTTTVEAPLHPRAAAATTRPATDFEARVAIATLLGTNTARHTAALAAFAELERQNPRDLTLLEAVGMFHVRAGRFDDARPYLERAIALSTANARIYVHLAEIRANTPPDDVAAKSEEESLLDKALSLAPDDAEVRIMMARSLVRQLRGADALAMLEPIARVPIEYERLFADTRAAALKILRRPADRSLPRGPGERRE